MLTLKAVAVSGIVLTIAGCQMFQPTGEMSSGTDTLPMGPWQQKGVLIRFTLPPVQRPVSDTLESAEEER